MAKNNNKDKGGAKVSFKSMIIAMVVALLGFLGFGGLELGNGDGADVDSGNQSGIVSEVEVEEEATKEMNDNSNEEENVFAIYVREDKIFIPDESQTDGYKEVSLEEIKEMLSTLDSSQKVTVIDDGAINKTYEEVNEIVGESGVRN